VTAERTRAWIEVDIAALVRNARTIAQHSGTQLLPMIKADAYGVGVGPVLRALEQLSPWGYGVATVAEGEELRALGTKRPVIVFTPLLSEELDRAADSDLTPTFGTTESIGKWAGRRPWHLAIDTGMLRAGADWRAVPRLREAIAKSPPAGAFTHFHSAEVDAASVAEQETRFSEALAALPRVPAVLHTDNSAAIIRRGRSDRTFVRPGIFLYGAGQFPDSRLIPDSVVSLRGRVVEIREAAAGDTVSYGATHRLDRGARVATVALGHADGYPIAMSNRAVALVRGSKVPVVGRVTMDMTMLDVTDTGCKVGDVVTFIGKDGDSFLSLDAVAKHGNVSPYELLVRMRNRLPRHYSGA
jgi:alanine racemase